MNGKNGTTKTDASILTTPEEVEQAMRDLRLYKCCYIAGPMTGLPQYNFGSFFAAEAVLRQDGWDVKNPARHSMDGGFDPRNGGKPTDEQMDKDRKWDVDQILEVDALFALHGWMSSKGAVAEVALAQWRGIPVHQIMVKAGDGGNIQWGQGPDAPPIVEITDIVGKTGANL